MGTARGPASKAPLEVPPPHLQGPRVRAPGQAGQNAELSACRASGGASHGTSRAFVRAGLPVTQLGEDADDHHGELVRGPSPVAGERGRISFGCLTHPIGTCCRIPPPSPSGSHSRSCRVLRRPELTARTSSHRSRPLTRPALPGGASPEHDPPDARPSGAPRRRANPPPTAGICQGWRRRNRRAAPARPSRNRTGVAARLLVIAL
jgi:hypothetical protein